MKSKLFKLKCKMHVMYNIQYTVYVWYTAYIVHCTMYNRPVRTKKIFEI